MQKAIKYHGFARENPFPDLLNPCSRKFFKVPLFSFRENSFQIREFRTTCLTIYCFKASFYVVFFCAQVAMVTRSSTAKDNRDRDHLDQFETIKISTEKKRGRGRPPKRKTGRKSGGKKRKNEKKGNVSKSTINRRAHELLKKHPVEVLQQAVNLGKCNDGYYLKKNFLSNKILLNLL